MNNFKLILVGVMCSIMLMGCSAANNHAATTETDRPRSTAAATAGSETAAEKTKSGMDKARNAAGDVADEAGNIVEDAGDAVNDAAHSVGNAVKTD